MCWVVTRARMDEDGDYEGTEVLRVCLRYLAAREAVDGYVRALDVVFDTHRHDDDGLLMEYSVTFTEGVTYTVTRTPLDR